MRIVVGASPSFHILQSGWLSLQENQLDVTDARQWARLFRPESLDAVLAEHVWEHLKPELLQQATQNVFDYLKRGGYARIAVPDGFHPNARYIEWVRPGGSGERFLKGVRTQAELDHQSLFNYRSLANLFRSVGFKVRLLEWFDEYGNFYQLPRNDAFGKVRLGHNYLWSNLLSVIVGAPYTSLVIDAVKPLTA
jgi:predicted SAM-dependent methyltransferase